VNTANLLPQRISNHAQHTRRRSSRRSTPGKLLEIPTEQHKLAHILCLVAKVARDVANNLFLRLSRRKLVNSTHIVAENEAQDGTEGAVLGRAVKGDARRAAVRDDLRTEVLCRPPERRLVDADALPEGRHEHGVVEAGAGARQRRRELDCAQQRGRHCDDDALSEERAGARRHNVAGGCRRDASDGGRELDVLAAYFLGQPLRDEPRAAHDALLLRAALYRYQAAEVTCCGLVAGRGDVSNYVEEG
jgi:hypothetical protein